MKPLTAALAFAGAVLLGSCASSDIPPGEGVPEHLERGAAGQGQIGPIDRTDDPFVNPRVGDTSPGHP